MYTMRYSGAFRAFLIVLLPFLACTSCSHNQAVKRIVREPGIYIVLATTDWGEGRPEDVTKVLLSVYNQLTKHIVVDSCISVSVEHNTRQNGTPKTPFALNDQGDYVVLLTAYDRRWAQYSYQFAHEMTHVLLRSKLVGSTPRFGKNAWLDESLAETASLYTMRAMAKDWVRNPPYSNWSTYSSSLAEYVDDRYKQDLAQPVDGKSLDTAGFVQKNSDRLRSKNSIYSDDYYLATRLLPLFEKHPEGWNAIRYMYVSDHDFDRDLGSLLQNWQSRCPARLKPFAHEFSLLLGVGAKSK